MGKFRQWLEKKPIVALISFGVAIVSWGIVALSVNSNTTRTIDNVPIELPSFGTSYQAIGLDVIDSTESYTCSVTVSGDRSIIGALTQDSFTVTPDFSSVTASGTYSLVLEASKNDELVSYSIDSVSPHYLSLTFGEVDSKKLTLTPVVTGISAAQGYVIQNMTCSPKTVTIIGSKEDIAEIEKATAEIKYTKELDSTFTITGTIRLYDAAGNELYVEGLRMDSESAEITIPVYKEGSIPLTVGFVNVPDGFDTSLIKYTLSHDSIRVAASEEALASVTEKVIGYVDLTDLKPDEFYSFPITLSSGFVNLDNLESVTMTVDFTGYDTIKLNVADIRTENVPAGYTVKVNTEKINNVTVIGPEEEIENISPSSVVAVIDFDQLVPAVGSSSVSVNFKIPTASGCWVVGSYSVVVEVTQG